jgi:2-polyprenyl-3-methyl-5-hydroxy-6-metoxy-1,4-benzoquinol methylase
MNRTDRERWNAKHEAAGESRPAAGLLVDALRRADLPRGRALDVACGRGRHAWALARAGFEVLAVDVSDVALDRLEATARDEGLVVETLRRDLARDGLPEGAFDLVVVVDFLDRGLFPALREAVAPGGAVFYQTFTVEQSEATGFRREFCLEDGELLAAFAGFEVLAHEQGEFDGRFQESLLARRPG